MAKRTASSSVADLIEQLMPLRSDPDKFHEVLAGCDAVLVGEAFAQLLSATASVEGPVGKRQKMARSCPSMPAETFVEAMLFLDRDTLESAMLVCRFMRDCIGTIKKDQLVLRPLSEVVIRFRSNHDPSYTLFVSRELRDEGATKMRLYFDSIPAINRYMRLAYCEILSLDFHDLRGGSEERFRTERDWLFGLLVARETHVGVQELVCLTDETAEFVALKD